MTHCQTCPLYTQDPEEYTQSSIPMGSTNLGSRILEKQIPESSKRQNLSILCAGNCLHSIYIEFAMNYAVFTLY